MISREDILRLGAIKGSNLMTVFLPTSEKSGGDSVKKSQLAFKNMLRDIAEDLSNKGISSLNIDVLLNPLFDKLEDQEFWNHQLKSLVIFRGTDLFEEYRLPCSFEPLFYISTRFLVWPLVRLIQDNGHLYLLSLGMENVSLYQVDRFRIKEVPVREFHNIRLEDVVGSDFAQKNLQMRSQRLPQGSSIYHGQGEGHEDRKLEIEKYYRAISKIVDKYMIDRDDPLILAGLDHHVSIFRTVCSSASLMEEYISTKPDSKELSWLHDQAWSLASKFFHKRKEASLINFNRTMNTNKSQMEIEHILPSAFQGKVGTLFVRKGLEIWGVYNPVKNTVRVDEHQTSSNVSLINLLTLSVMEKGGDVFILEDEELPDDFLDLFALYRY